MKFELRHLRYVLAAAEQQSFRRAALSLSVEPSTISRRIREVEDEIGAALFIRAHSGVTLTYAGERFICRARQAIGHLTEATLDVGAIGTGDIGLVKVGLMSSMASGFISELLNTYSSAHEDVRIVYIEGESSDHLPAIKQHRLDVAFLTGISAANDCEAAHLWSERVYVAMSHRNELCEKQEIEWNDLRDREFVVSEGQSGSEIHDYLVKHLAELGYSPNVQRHAVYRDTLMQIVANGRDLTLTSEATIAARFPGVVYRPLKGEVLPFCAVWSRNNDNPAVRRLLSLAKIISKRCNSCWTMNRSQDPLVWGETGSVSAVPLRNLDPSK